MVTAPAEKRTTPNRGWILAALMCTIMLAAMDTTIVSTAIPQIVGDLGGFSLFSWVYSGYLLAQTVTIPLYGKLADLYGRKPVLLFGMIVFLLGSVASAASWDMNSLIVFRGLQGIGAGSIMATVNTIAGDIYTIRERAEIQGWLSSVWGIAAIIGPALGGAFAEYASWRWIFLINLPIGFMAILLLVVFFKEKIERHDHYIDYPGTFMTLVTGVVLVYTLMGLGQRWAFISIPGMGMLLGSLILILLTIRIENRSPEPIMPNWIWKNKILTGANLAVIMMGAAMLGPNMYLPVVVQSIWGLGAIAAGFVLASLSIGWPLASSFSGRLYLKIGFRNTAIIGAIIIIIASIGFILLPYRTSVWFLVVDQALLGAGFGLLSTSVLVGVQSIVAWDQRGVVTGANMFSRYLGQSIGAAIIGGVFNAAMRKHLVTAPAELNLPAEINDVITIVHSQKNTVAVNDYLRYSFYYASHLVWGVMAILGVLSFLFLMFQPRRFPVVKE